MTLNSFGDVYILLVVPALVDRFGLLPEEIHLSSYFKEDLKLDSLDMVDVLCEIEDIYDNNLVLDDNESDKIAFTSVMAGTVKDLTVLVFNIIKRHEEKVNNE